MSVPLQTCDACGNDYRITQLKEIREDDEGGIWLCCGPCWDAIQDTADLMEG